MQSDDITTPVPKSGQGSNQRPATMHPSCYILDLRIDEKKVDESRGSRHALSGTGNTRKSSGEIGTGGGNPFKQLEVNMMTIDGIDRIDGRVKIRRSDKEKFVCDQCGKRYASSSNLSRHKQTHRSINSEAAKSCPHCTKVYVSMPALAMHMLTHKLQHQCSTCGKSFSRSWLLQCHLRSHSGEKPYGCAHCGRSFGDRSNLRAHMHLHTTEKLHSCEICGKTFALKSYLNKHIESCRTFEMQETAAEFFQQQLDAFRLKSLDDCNVTADQPPIF